MCCSEQLKGVSSLLLPRVWALRVKFWSSCLEASVCAGWAISVALFKFNVSNAWVSKKVIFLPIFKGSDHFSNHLTFIWRRKTKAHRGYVTSCVMFIGILMFFHSFKNTPLKPHYLFIFMCILLYLIILAPWEWLFLNFSHCFYCLSIQSDRLHCGVLHNVSLCMLCSDSSSGVRLDLTGSSKTGSPWKHSKYWIQECGWKHTQVYVLNA